MSTRDRLDRLNNAISHAWARGDRHLNPSNTARAYAAIARAAVGEEVYNHARAVAAYWSEK